MQASKPLRVPASHGPQPIPRHPEDRATGRSKAMALVVSFRAASESFMEHTKERRHTGYRGPTANSEETRDGQLKVLTNKI